MRNLDVKDCTQNQADIAKRAFAKVEHGKCSDDYEHRITHALKAGFTKQRRHRAFRHSSAFNHTKRMVAMFIGAAVVCVVIVVVVNKAGFSTAWTRGIWPLARSPSLPLSRPRAVGGRLVVTSTALIFLITVRILAVTIKVLRVVAFRAYKMIWFHHENLSFIREYLGFVVKPLYYSVWGVLNFHLTLQYGADGSVKLIGQV